MLTLAVAAVAAVATWGVGAALSAGWVAADVGTTASTAAGAATTAAGAVATITQTTLPWWATAIDTAIQGIVGSSVKFLGSQLINALIPPPRTPVPKQATTPHSYTVSGTANAAAPFSPIPKIYGQRRIFPQYAASPYNELVGFNQYLRMLFLLGYGPLDISQIKIGDTAIEDYEDVEWELRAGLPDDAPMRLYPGSVSEAGFNIQLSKTNGGGVAPTVYDWSQNYVADGYWTALRTIRDQPPYAMAGLALLAVRIRASRQLSGAIANLNCVAASILPDYDSTTERLNIRVRVAVTTALAMAIVTAIVPQILILAIKLETASRQAGDEHPCLRHAVGLLERPFLACRFIIGTLLIAFLRKRGASTINEKPQGPRRAGAGGICVALTLLGDKAMIHLFLRQAGTPCK